MINNFQETKCENCYSFFVKYLLIASRNLYRNQKAIESSIQFKKDLINSISTVNSIFECNFSYKQDFENKSIDDYYKYLFSRINLPSNELKSNKFVGEYHVCNDKFNTRFFQPYILYSEYHSWYFSDTPIAILCINSEKFTFSEEEKQTEQKNCQLIKLEIDRIAASGLTLVLCVNYSPSIIDFLLQIIVDDQFSEVQIDLTILCYLLHLMFLSKSGVEKNDCSKNFFSLYSVF